MQEPPGIVTFLFTDIEGSTRLWQELPVQMGQALRLHDAMMREVIESNRGQVFKTVGDAFCAVFVSPQDALKAMAAAQSLIQSTAWPDPIEIRVRMAAHSGAAEERDGDYFGKTLNRVSRLLGIVHGGQCVASSAVQVLTREELPDGLALRPLGDHRLKDLESPESVYQLEWAGSRSEFPRLLSLDHEEFPNNLPSQSTSFVAREEELHRVLSLLDHARLLTLTGSGGCGKTRLALQAAAELVGKYPDGVWFVDLAPVLDAGLVAQTTLAALRAAERVNRSPEDALADYVRDQNVLIVLDNCEHVIDACARLVHRVLTNSPNVKFICTSREPLAIYGEVTYRVPSLGLPEPAAHLDAVTLDQYAATRLFIDRAIAADPTFTVTNQNAPTVADICHRLDGIPLAIELAAARVRSLAVEDIRNHLNANFRILTGGNRVALPRHQTITSLIDWSYNLLSPPEQDLLTRLSCFTGGWTLSAAEEVCSGGGLESSDILDLMTSLVDKSLVTSHKTDQGTRFGFLETVRQYSRAILDQKADAGSVFEKHTQWVVELIVGSRSKLEEADAKYWMAQFDAEADNIRAALARALADPDGGETACQIGFEFGVYCFQRGLLFEGIDQCQRAVDHAAATPTSEARLRTMNILGWICHITQNTARAKATYSELLKLSTGVSPYGEIAARNGLGLVAEQHEFDYETALDHFMAVLSYARANGMNAETPLMNIAHTLSAMTRYDEAETYIRECIESAKRGGRLEALVTSNYVLGCLYEMKAELESAVGPLKESVEMARENGFRFRLFSALVRLADVLQGLGRDAEAWELIEEGLVMVGHGKMPDAMLELPPVHANALIRMGRLEEARAVLVPAIENESVGWTNLNNSFCLVECARLFAIEGKLELAAQTLGIVRGSITDSHSPFHPEWLERFQKVADLVLQGMDQTTFEANLEIGSTLTEPSARVLLLGELQAPAPANHPK